MGFYWIEPGGIRRSESKIDVVCSRIFKYSRNSVRREVVKNHVDEDVERIQIPQVLEEGEELDISFVLLHMSIHFVFPKVVRGEEVSCSLVSRVIGWHPVWMFLLRPVRSLLWPHLYRSELINRENCDLVIAVLLDFLSQFLNALFLFRTVGRSTPSTSSSSDTICRTLPESA